MAIQQPLEKVGNLFSATLAQRSITLYLVYTRISDITDYIRT